MMKSEQISRKTAGLPGTLLAEYVRCGKPACGCMSGGSRHGPYFRRFWREGGRTRSVYVPLAQVAQVDAACARYRQLHMSRRAFRRMLRDFDRWTDDVIV